MSSADGQTCPLSTVSGGTQVDVLSPGKEAAPEVEMSIPGLDWGMDEVMGKDAKKVPQKKVPYAKPIPAQFQQVNTCRGHLINMSPSADQCL